MTPALPVPPASAPEAVAVVPPAPPVERVRRMHKHPLAIRWLHWINFPVLALMIWSGILILWAYPKYPSEKYAVPVPNRISLYRWGAAVVLPEKDQPDYPVPQNQRYDIVTGFRLAEGMAWHFNLAWLFTLNGVAYTVFLFVSGQWRYLFPRRESLKESFKVVLHDVGLWKQPLPIAKYNDAQRIAYTAVLFMGFWMVVTGLAIYKPAQLTWLASLLGGYQAARLQHFVVTFLFVGFFFVHVAQVARAGWNNFRGMITGWEIRK